MLSVPTGWARVEPVDVGGQLVCSERVLWHGKGDADRAAVSAPGLGLGKAVQVDISLTPRVESALGFKYLKVRCFQANGFKLTSA